MPGILRTWQLVTSEHRRFALAQFDKAFAGAYPGKTKTGEGQPIKGLQDAYLDNANTRTRVLVQTLSWANNQEHESATSSGSVAKNALS